MNNTKKAIIIILPIVILIIYNILNLDTKGGFFENNELFIKLILLSVSLVGSIVSYIDYLLVKGSYFLSIGSLFFIFLIFVLVLSILFLVSIRWGIGF